MAKRIALNVTSKYVARDNAHEVLTKRVKEATPAQCSHPLRADTKHRAVLYPTIMGRASYDRRLRRLAMVEANPFSDASPFGGLLLVGGVITLLVLALDPTAGIRLVAIIIAAVVMVIAMTRFMDHIFERRIQFLGGPHDEKIGLMREGSVACSHGYLLSALCDGCMECVIKDSQQWYAIVGERAIYTPPENAVVPGIPDLIVDMRVSSICRMMTEIINDATAGGLAADLIRVVTKLLHQDQQGEQFDALVDTLQQQALMIVSTSTRVAPALVVARGVAVDDGELSLDERKQVSDADEFLGKIQALLAVSNASPKLHAEIKSIGDIRSRFQAALAAKRKPPTEPNGELTVFAEIRHEIEVIDAGVRTLNSESGTSAPRTETGE